jgi:predicted DNA-binding protein (UPF0251 family)
MPPPHKHRKVGCQPRARVFKPQGVPTKQLEAIGLGLDELEAMRLAHLEGLSQQQIGEAMGISRATAGRILEQAHQRVTRALVNGCALEISALTPIRPRDGQKRHRRRGRVCRRDGVNDPKQEK